MTRQVFAFSGMLEGPDTRGRNLALTAHALAIGRGRRLCYVPTAIGDPPSAVADKRAALATLDPPVVFTALTLFPQPNVRDVRAHLLAQDVLLVEGGSVVNLMAVWRAHGLAEVMRDCWESGVVLAGASAGSLCWHTGGPTDSFGNALAPFTDGLGLLPFSNGVHDDFRDQPRRETYRSLVADGTLTAGYASEDGVGLHYVDEQLHEAVSVRPGARAWHVAPDGHGGCVETALPARLLL